MTKHQPNSLSATLASRSDHGKGISTSKLTMECVGSYPFHLIPNDFLTVLLPPSAPTTYLHVNVLLLFISSTISTSTYSSFSLTLVTFILR